MADCFPTPYSGEAGESGMDLIDFSNGPIDTVANSSMMANTCNTIHNNPLPVNTSYLDDLQDILFTTPEEDHGNMSGAEGAENSSTMGSSANLEKSDVSESSFEIPEDWQQDSYPVISHKQDNNDPSALYTSLGIDQTEQILSPIHNDLHKLTESEPYLVSHEDCVKSYDTLSDDLGLVQVQGDTHPKTTGDTKKHISDLKTATHPEAGWDTVSSKASQSADDTLKFNISELPEVYKHDITDHGRSEEQPVFGLTWRPREHEFPAKAPLNLDIRKYFENQNVDSPGDHWLKIPDVPTAEEILYTGALQIPANIIKGPWYDKDLYLQNHFELLREDAVSPLRAVVAEIRANPKLVEADMRETGGIYEAAHVTGMTFATKGIATRVEFSLRRTGKQIRWEQSKRLMAGGLVALTPTSDAFKTVCRVGVVAARPLSGLQKYPPVIDIFFKAPTELEIDPQQEWLMVEARNAYWESYRHTLCALQKMAQESFPLVDHLVNVQRNVPAPAYLYQKPMKDLSSIATSDSKKYTNVNILEGWPRQMKADLDHSQTDALRRILTKQLAVIQGPPGTGKTYVSVEALKLLLNHHKPGDPPIIVAAHTNHALDQILRHIAQFEPKFIRIGGRSADIEVIKPRTLWEVRQTFPLQAPAGGFVGAARKHRRELSRMMSVLLKPLRECCTSLPVEEFFDRNLITKTQLESLREGAADWVTGFGNGSSDPIGTWLGEHLVPFIKRNSGKQYGLDFEEADLEFEQLKDLEAEVAGGDEESFDVLRGEWMPLSETLTGRNNYKLNDQKFEALLREQDMWKIDESYRGPVYCYLQRKYKEALRRDFQKVAADYQKTIEKSKIGLWEMDYGYLYQTRIIGMTTTGLSKNRGLIASLKPKIVLIEEAAETFEAHVAVACFDSLEHLILVGDHQQLRPRSAVQELDGEPFNLSVSLFERLVTNNIEFSQLTSQRRMLPEFRKIMNVIYENLDDHPSVYGRENIPGMGGINSFFFTHTFSESTDDQLSKVNQDEAAMIVGFFDYLVCNGTTPSNITVLTFYNGQRKAILSGLRKHPNMHGFHFNVVTVDSYQGEENEVVLLSLVRNSDEERGGIGFLNVENRVCVALSRARRGFYLFGNHSLLAKYSPLWYKVLKVLNESPSRIGRGLPITCQPHQTRLELKHPSQWQRLNGGCNKICNGTLPCGHACQLKCHISDHSMIICTKPCNRPLKCGHPCLEQCFVKQCVCKCGNRRATQLPLGLPSVNISPMHPSMEENMPPMLQDWLSRTSTPRGRALGTPSRSFQTPTKVRQLSPPYNLRSTSSNGSPSAARSYSSVRPYSATRAQAEAAQIKAYQEYAAGGHIDSDKKINARAIAAHEEQRRMLARQAVDSTPTHKPNGAKASVSKNVDVETPTKMEALMLEKDVENTSGGRVKRTGMWIGGLVPRIDEQVDSD